MIELVCDRCGLPGAYAGSWQPAGDTPRFDLDLCAGCLREVGIELSEDEIAINKAGEPAEMADRIARSRQREP